MHSSVAGGTPVSLQRLRRREQITLLIAVFRDPPTCFIAFYTSVSPSPLDRSPRVGDAFCALSWSPANVAD
jgi:hypothetical protein